MESATCVTANLKNPETWKSELWSPQLYGFMVSMDRQNPPNRYLVDLGTLSLVGSSHIKMRQVCFWSWLHECSVIVWPTLAGKTQNQTLRTLQTIWEFHGVATCIQVLDWREIHRTSTLQHGPFFKWSGLPCVDPFDSTKCLPWGNHPAKCSAIFRSLNCPTRLANHAYKALSYDVADLPSGVPKKPQLQQVTNETCQSKLWQGAGFRPSQLRPHLSLVATS